MTYFLNELRLQLRQRKTGSWLLWLLALAILVLALVIPAPQTDALVQVGVVLPREGGEDFARRLQQRGTETITFVLTDAQTARRQVLVGRMDCALILSEDFEEKIETMEVENAFTLVIGPGSSAYPLVRETAASCMIACMSPHIAESFLEEQGISTERLPEVMTRLEGTASRVRLQSQTLGGENLSQLQLVRSGAHRALRGVTVLLLLVWGLYLGAELARWLESSWAKRLCSVRSVKEVLLPKLCGGLLPLWLWGLVCVWLTGGKVLGGAVFTAFALLAALFALWLARHPGIAGSVGALMPFVITGSLILEPVLVDVSAFVPALRYVTGLLPVSCCIRGMDGDFLSLGILGIWLAVLLLACKGKAQKNGL